MSREGEARDVQRRSDCWTQPLRPRPTLIRPHRRKLAHQFGRNLVLGYGRGNRRRSETLYSVLTLTFLIRTLPCTRAGYGLPSLISTCGGLVTGGNFGFCAESQATCSQA